MTSLRMTEKKIHALRLKMAHQLNQLLDGRSPYRGGRALGKDAVYQQRWEGKDATPFDALFAPHGIAILQRSAMRLARWLKSR